MNSLSVTGSVAGNPCEMIIDTGSNITIIRPDVLRRCGESTSSGLQPVNGSVKTVTGDTTPIRSKGKLKILIGSTEVEHEL